jgi:23S rRNA maturation-related 3'-5' exoribonuclease YhaM
MIKKINLDAILASNTKGEKHEGVGYVLSYTKKVSEGNGKQFITFNLCDNGTVCSGKVWQENVEAFEKATQNSKIINISGTVDTFGGTSSIVVTSCSEYIGPFTIVDFVKGIDENELETRFWNFIKDNASTNVETCLRKIFEEPIVKERYFKEFAGKMMHDALPGGLANHVLKMLDIFKTLSTNIPFWKQNSDLMIMGIALHDIGKIEEMTNGSYNKNSFLTHIYRGIALLEKYKELIVSEFSLDFYEKLISILIGHHDEYETKARTIYAMIVYMIDNLDAKSTGFAEDYEANNFTTSDNGDQIFKRDNLWI